MAKKETTSGKTTSVAPCSCAHAQQDRIYGRNLRLHNRCNKGRRCTVCGSVK